MDSPSNATTVQESNYWSQLQEYTLSILNCIISDIGRVPLVQYSLEITIKT